MKVEMKSESNRVQLFQLDSGDVFLDEDDDLCILTDEEKDHKQLTVVLQAGVGVWRDPSYVVTPIKAKVVPDEE